MTTAVLAGITLAAIASFVAFAIASFVDVMRSSHDEPSADAADLPEPAHDRRSASFERSERLLQRHLELGEIDYEEYHRRIDELIGRDRGTNRGRRD